MLFETPGWDVPTKIAGPSSQPKKANKRKRPSPPPLEVPTSSKKGTDGQTEKPQQVSGELKPSGVGSEKPKKEKNKKKRKKHEEEAVGKSSVPPTTTSAPADDHYSRSSSLAPSDTPALAETATTTTPTAFQSTILNTLSGPRFRVLNETLYTTPGHSAHSLMQSDPQSFKAYHEGFRHQVKGWPVNPVDLLVNKLRDAGGVEGGLVVADLGCGEAGLAKALMGRVEGKKGKSKGKGLEKGQGNFRVLSYDLVADPEGWIIEAECASKVPLPGNHGDAPGGQIVDSVVCCLSLMGTDWVGILLEARRILRASGSLHIAEVTSRFPSLPKFTKFLESKLGLDLVSKDEKSSTHFVMMEFKKGKGRRWGRRGGRN